MEFFFTPFALRPQTVDKILLTVIAALQIESHFIFHCTDCASEKNQQRTQKSSTSTLAEWVPI